MCARVHENGWAAAHPPHYVAAVHSRLLALTIVSVVAIAACSSDDDAASTGAPPETTEAVTATTGAPEENATETTEATPETTEAPPETTEPTPADLEIAPDGPYDVGVTTITINAESERALTLDVWFPIADAGEAPLHQYTLIPGAYYESPDAVTATPDQISPDGPFPLVVYSHGSGGLRYIASYYTEAIASYGYVVAAPDHTGNTAVDRLVGAEAEFDVTALNRPNDVRAVIDAMLDPTSTETAGFVPSVDPEQIAVTGHSFGGFTALAAAGGYENPLGSVVADDRVDAIIPLAPATGDGTRLMSDAGLESIQVPTLVLVGTNDQTTPVEPNVTRIWDLAGSEPLVRVELVDAQHQSFTDVCDYQEFLPALGDAVPQPVLDTIESQGAEGCSPGDMPIDRAKDLTNTFAVNFLESVFRDAEPITDADITIPDDVIFMAR
jgi:predicted dienelactone hydrolase